MVNQLPPEAPANHFQQIVKEMTFHRAELYLDEVVGLALRAIPLADGTNHLYVPENPTGGQQVIHFDAGDNHIDPDHHVLVDTEQQAYAIQCDNDRLRQFVAVLTSGSRVSLFSLADRADQATSAPQSDEPLTVTTPYWSLQVDAQTGSLTSLRDQTSQHEWVASGQAYGFGQLVHEASCIPSNAKRSATSPAGYSLALRRMKHANSSPMGQSPNTPR